MHNVCSFPSKARDEGARPGTIIIWFEIFSRVLGGHGGRVVVNIRNLV